MKHIIYKITNNLNGRYYIGRHSTNNVDDGYMGSGIGIKNAIEKYGEENFTKEIIAEATSTSELWDLERDIVNESVVKDPMSYNMAYGGKHYLDGLAKNDQESFKVHQSKAGKKGGSVCYSNKTNEDKEKWHRSGGKKCAALNKQNGTHPFWNGEAASLGGKALKGMVELWNPVSKATNKNQKEYRSGDCKRVFINTEKYNQLVSSGWKGIEEHAKQLINLNKG